jgi:hypothetical protein
MPQWEKYARFAGAVSDPLGIGIGVMGRLPFHSIFFIKIDGYK